MVELMYRVRSYHTTLRRDLVDNYHPLSFY
nr:MAG TPA_asm: hypothetical protein [Caudoviricetes sp.]DAO64016.1 MAG TPA: hypothetical protein [Bacteriophage sp.]DAU88386.1 MAG TPA: hypothetical protein [Caudoviricetes sp.]